jgi:Uncharacterized alpha/beta hydrolase domain (DUF2235)
MARNLVVCLDGTSNEPETGATNVARIFEVATKDETQLVYYDARGRHDGRPPRGDRRRQAGYPGRGLVGDFGLRFAPELIAVDEDGSRGDVSPSRWAAHSGVSSPPARPAD